MATGRHLSRALVPLMILLTYILFAQEAMDETQASVNQLIHGLQLAVSNGSPVNQFFSPTARVSEKAKIDLFATKGFLKFEILNYTLKDLRQEDAQHVSLPVTLKWSTRNEEASKSVTLRFVKEGSTWYFEQPDFWVVSLSWSFFPLIAIAIAYGCSAVVMYRHANRQQWLQPSRRSIWQALSVVPLLPVVYFQWKPWRQQ